MDYVNIPDKTSPSLIHRLSNHVSKNRLKVITLFACLIVVYSQCFNGLSTYNARRMQNSSMDTYNMKTTYDDLHIKYNKLPTNASLRAQLSYYFPYDTNSKIPQSIFQTWKSKPGDSNFPMDFLGTVSSWEKNEGYAHTIFTDNVLDDWVHTEFSNVPDLVRAWDLLPKIILKADFFRYLVIYARGGIYSDMDTFCLKNIHDWAPFNERYTKGEQIGFVIGIEADPDRPDWAEWYARRIQFAQWTIMGKRGHPFLRELISRIVEETLRKEHMGYIKHVEGKDSGSDIMQWTGPGIYTDTMFDYLNNILSDGDYGSGFGIGSKYWNDGEKYKLKHQEVNKDGLPLHFKDMVVNYKAFTGLREPKVIDDVMVLPITSFSPGVGQMGSRSPRDPMAFVQHIFHGSWKDDKKKD
ncbi:hypothetical protein CAS74_003972 [Pichia kudriavzevii]|uniref:Initiation-specific alpha-1,6-mannosyltransferase n=1 Tax=Pichia kudriavzevii TaxID=4909 RepID=A0A1Z8JK69_PICKU|nr:hypothetical protein CAS74_003972 [Pichia kudriavzevii]